MSTHEAISSTRMWTGNTRKWIDVNQVDCQSINGSTLHKFSQYIKSPWIKNIRQKIKNIKNIQTKSGNRRQ